jgi:hypothetical protein
MSVKQQSLQLRMLLTAVKHFKPVKKPLSV